MIRMTMLAFLMFLTAPALHASPPAKPVAKTPFQLMDVFKLQYASDPQISADGERVIYVRNSMDILKDRRRSALWEILPRTQRHQPVVDGDVHVSSPSISPDGKKLAYIASADKRFKLRCRWLDTRAETTLLDSAQPLDCLSWSPDSKQLAYAAVVPVKEKRLVDLPMPKGASWAKPALEISKTYFRMDGSGYAPKGYRQIFVVGIEAKTPRQLTTGSVHHPSLGKSAPLSWSPDGKTLYFSANRDPDWEMDPLESEIHALTIDTGDLTALTKRDGPDFHPVVSPDGKKLAYLGYDDKKLGYHVDQLYVMDLASRKTQTLLPTLDRDIASPAWSLDSDVLCFQYDDMGVTKLGYTSLKSGGTSVVTFAENVGGTSLDRPYASGSFTISQNGHVAYTETSPDQPANVAVATITKDLLLRTNLNADLFAQRKLATVEEFWFTSSHDQRKIQGWLVKPPDFDPAKKYPLILEIHGGPFANYGPRFAADMQLYAAAGHVVLYINPRGSTSYGKEFANLIHHAYPGNDYDDLMSGVDAAIARGFIDAKNLYVTGGSGGGILSAWIIGRTGRFRAAVVCKPVINWYSFVLNADIYPFFAQYWFPGPPWEHAEHYLRRSPISLAGNVTTPTMVITGEEDLRTPMSESEQLYQALKLRKIDTMLVRIPGAFHNIAARPSQLIAKAAYVLKWFETHPGK